MIPEDRDPTPSEEKAAFDNLLKYMEDFDVSQSEMAAGSGESASTLSAFFNKSDRVPPHKRVQLLRSLNNWIEEDAKQRALIRPDNFHMTIIAHRFKTVADETRASRMMSLTYGPAGIGKTFCAEAYCAEVPGTIYVRVNRATRSAAAMLQAIYNGSRRKTRSRFRARYEDVVSVLKGSGRLLIVDQIWRVQRGGMELLWDIHDDCNIPILMIGTVIDKKRVESEEDIHGGQLSSRVKMRRDLFPEVDEYLKRGGGGGSRQGPPAIFNAEAIRAIYQRKFKLHNDAIKQLVHIANYELGKGHLRRVDAIMYWAERIATKKRITMILLEHIEQAIRIVDDKRRQQIAQAEVAEREAVSA